MSLLGIRLTVLIGPTVAVPAPPQVTEALESVEVTRDDSSRSGFQIALRVGRSEPSDLLDYKLLLNPLLRPFNRVILIVTIGVVPRVLIDGIITHQQLHPSSEPGASRFTLTGEDVSFMMDREEKNAEHPAQPDPVIAAKLIASYAQYGLIPKVIPPLALDLPIPLERTPVQRGTDHAYLTELAERHGYVFYVEPGPAPFTNFAYWGPPVRVGAPQKALSVDMGHQTNVDSIDFQHAAAEPTLVSGSVQDRLTNQSIPVQTFASTRIPLSSQPGLLTNFANARSSLPGAHGGLNAISALGRAQGVTDVSTDQVVTASGEMDALRYGDVLQARGIVGVRGVGYHYGGNYYVQRVTHSIRLGEYKQRFTLAREGVGALLPVVRP